jgi:hypothetical protein
MSKQKRHYLDSRGTVAVYEELRKVCAQLNGMAVYSDGESDATVAERLGFEESNVRTVREQNFGQLRKLRKRRQPPPDEMTIMKAMLEDHERRLKQLESTRQPPLPLAVKPEDPPSGPRLVKK